VDNPTYRLPDVDHRAEEVVFVLGSYDQDGLEPALPFIQKFNAIDGELLWKRTLGEVSSSSSHFHLSLDVLRFYRSDLILGGRLFSPSSSVTPSNLTTTLVDDSQRKVTQTTAPLSSVSAFYATISEVAFTSEIQPVKLNLKLLASTNFASADSRTMIVTDVTTQISLFAASLYRVREDQQRFEVFGEEKRGGAEVLIYLARTTYDGQGEAEGEGEEGEGKGEGLTREEGGTSFVEMLLRAHRHHPDWNDRMGLSGVSNGSLFLAVLVVFCYIGLIVYLTRKCQVEYSTEQFVSYCPPPRCIDPYSSSSSSGATV
jgi:hypothetical protein